MAAPETFRGPLGLRLDEASGEGPTETADGAFKEDATFSAQDIRFTTRGDALYAITLGEPRRSVAMTSLGRRSPIETKSARNALTFGIRSPGDKTCFRFFAPVSVGLRIVRPASHPSSALARCRSRCARNG